MQPKHCKDNSFTWFFLFAGTMFCRSLAIISSRSWSSWRKRWSYHSTVDLNVGSKSEGTNPSRSFAFWKQDFFGYCVFYYFCIKSFRYNIVFKNWCCVYWDHYLNWHWPGVNCWIKVKISFLFEILFRQWQSHGLRHPLQDRRKSDGLIDGDVVSVVPDFRTFLQDSVDCLIEFGNC